MIALPLPLMERRPVSRAPERVAGAPRADALPEHLTYRDTGCPDGQLPSCLECPLEVCRYDEQAGRYKDPKRAMRDDAIRRLRSEGRTIQEVAAAIGVSVRTVIRASAQ